jgi:hypothetical protein
MRVLGLLPLAAVAAALVAPAQAETARTTRIETRPIYGAVVTIEHGVRVWRPVPPTDRLIVNPDRVPLVLSVENPAAAYWPR